MHQFSTSMYSPQANIGHITKSFSNMHEQVITKSYEQVITTSYIKFSTLNIIYSNLDRWNLMQRLRCFRGLQNVASPNRRGRTRSAASSTKRDISKSHSHHVPDHVQKIEAPVANLQLIAWYTMLPVSNFC